MARARLRAVAPDLSSASEEELLLAVARGDRVAFSLLYDRLAGRVHGLVRRLVRDPAQSEEVTQEVLVEVWRTATRFDPDRGSVATWVLTLAHRRAVDHIRAEQAHRDRSHRAELRDHEPAFDGTVEAAERTLDQEQVGQALRTLTDLQRETVELAYYGGYTYPEVAELLGVPLGTVKTRIRDGFIRLRDALGVTR